MLIVIAQPNWAEVIESLYSVAWREVGASSGMIIKLNFEGLFLGSGFLMILVAIWMYFTPSARSLGAQMVGSE